MSLLLHHPIQISPGVDLAENSFLVHEPPRRNAIDAKASLANTRVNAASSIFPSSIFPLSSHWL